VYTNTPNYVYLNRGAAVLPIYSKLPQGSLAWGKKGLR